MMEKLRVLDLFSGIGGFSLGLERTGGFETVAFCEIEEFPRKVLAKHWPDVPCHHDATKLKGSDVGPVDVICGGFPCQDLSSAGRGKGLGEGTRSGLFRHMLRLAEECGRPIIIFENVARLLSGPTDNPGEWFCEFLNALAEIGYDAEWFCITASSVGAPHERDRVWVVAYASEKSWEAVRGECETSTQEGFGWRNDRDRSQGNDEWKKSIRGSGKIASTLHYANKTPIQRGSISSRVYQEHADIDRARYDLFTSDATSQRQQGQGMPETRVSSAASGKWKTTYAFSGGVGTIWQAEPAVGRVAHGIPNQSHRLGSLGNSVVPQIPELIGRAILGALNDGKTA